MALVLTAEQMKAVDRAAIEKLGVPSLVLMENAGRGVAELIRQEREIVGRSVQIVCGVGQNGGDGFVVARHLANAGARVTVLLAAPRAKLAGDALINAQIVEQMPAIVVREAADIVDIGTWRGWLGGADVIVDAIFGTGLRADVTGVAAAAIEAINQTPAWRVAVDLPSGLDADSGRPRGVAVAADLTATIACRKLGLSLEAEGPAGRVQVVDFGVGVEHPTLTDAARAHGPLCHWIDGAEMAALIPRRPPGAHKGSAGHLLVVAGSPGKIGAALLTARGAQRGGAGLVTIASTRAGQMALDSKVLEAMTASFSQNDDADTGSYNSLLALARRMQAAALGPGIPTGTGMRALVLRLVGELPLPLVVDADGLNLLGPDAARVLRSAPAPRILTPHPGEMGRLRGVSTGLVQATRLSHARGLAADSGAVVVLKGARTLIAAPDGTAHINPTANPALGTAGSGDVLTGLIAALCAQGLPPIDAARLGVYLHGLAADTAIATLGSRLLVAGDLPDAIARTCERLQQNLIQTPFA
jgi:ADP-dependent NAD(P)H-hydrate dehydratase / NAD(P)H-hydrate epimerase